MFCAVLGIAGYAVVWALVAGISIANGDWNGTLMLGILTVPSSAAVGLMINALDVRSLGGELAMFLPIGAAQYALVGYVVGLGVRAVHMLWRSRAS